MSEALSIIRSDARRMLAGTALLALTLFYGLPLLVASVTGA